MLQLQKGGIMTKGLCNMINEVDEMDRDAAEWLKTESMTMPTYTDSHYDDNVPPSTKLARLFVWRDSPQGGQYWSNLQDRLAEKEAM
jgi:hypothetical protein